jgi:hypothetical protein
MVGNPTDKELAVDESESALEGELLTIMRERDEVEEDRSDTIVRNSAVFDLNHTMDREECFVIVSGTTAERWNIPAASVSEVSRSVGMACSTPHHRATIYAESGRFGFLGGVSSSDLTDGQRFASILSPRFVTLHIGSLNLD